MAWNWVVQIIIAVAVSVVSYLIAPRPKQPKPPAAKDLEAPTAESGKPIPKIFGTITVKGLNILWYGDKEVREYKHPVSGGGKKG